MTRHPERASRITFRVPGQVAVAPPRVLTAAERRAQGPQHRAITPTVMPMIAVSSFGLLLVCIGYAIGWNHGSETLALTFFYVGFALMMTVGALVLIRPATLRRNRLTVAVAQALILYASFVLSNPLRATRFDETLHVGTLRDLAAGYGLFYPNPMLAISPYYPGLELETLAVKWLTGLPAMASQIVVVGVSRVVLTIVLFLLIERLTRSDRAAGVGVLLYMASTQFWFFNAQYSYQSVAITYAVATVWLLVRLTDQERVRWYSFLPVAAVMGGLVLSHHLTSWLTFAFVWVLVGWHLLRRSPRTRRLAVGALVFTVLIGAWSIVLIPMLRAYLLPIFSTAAGQLAGIAGGSDEGRQMFTADNGYRTPQWQQLLLLWSAAMWTALAFFACLSVLRKRLFGGKIGAWLVMACAGTYPFLLVARFSPGAAEIAERASSFVFLAMVLIVGAWLTYAPPPNRTAVLDRIPRAVTVPVVVALAVAGCIMGSGPDWSRVPGPFLVAAQQRSLDAEVLAAADWAAHNLPDESRFAGDTHTMRIMPTISNWHPVTASGGDVAVTEMFIRDTVDQGVRDLLEEERISYIFVDTRLPSQPPHSGWYFEPVTIEDGPPVTDRMMQKFENTPGFTKVYDGPVRIYDVTDVSGVRNEEPPAGQLRDPLAGHPGQMLVSLALAVFALVFYRRRLLGLVQDGDGRWAGPVAHRLLAAMVGLTALGGLMGLALPWAWTGSVTLLAAVLLITWNSQRRSGRLTAEDLPSVREWQPKRGTVPWTVAAVVLVTAGIGLATWTAVQGQSADNAVGHAVEVTR